MRNFLKLIVLMLTGALVLTGCGFSNEASDRKEQQNSVTLKDSLEIKNLKERLQRENDPNAVRYVYLMNFGQIVGYYVIEGKVSSAGSQLAPEQEIIKNCDVCSERSVVDSAQDDGTFGQGDPGVFFFLADGTMVTTDLNVIQSDAPLTIDVPRLGGGK